MGRLDVLWLDLASLLHIQLPFLVEVPEGTSMGQFETHTSAKRAGGKCNQVRKRRQYYDSLESPFLSLHEHKQKLSKEQPWCTINKGALAR